MEKILVIEDNAIHQEYFKTILSNEGFSVMAVNNGRDGLEKYSKEKPDLVLMDVKLPVMDGFETARLIRRDAATQHVPIIFVSGVLSDRESRNKALELGGNDYIIKPIDADDLLLKIRASLRTKRYCENLLRSNRLTNVSEKKYRSILELIGEGYFEVDLNGNITFFNDSACRIFGYPPKHFLGNNARSMVKPEMAERMTVIFDSILKTGEPASMVDCEINRGDGSTCVLEMSAGLLMDARSVPAGFHCVVRDITKKKHDEHDLQIKKIAVDKSINAIVITDPAGNITFANSAFLRMWGYDAMTEVCGCPIRSFWNSGNDECTIDIMDILVEVGTYVGELMVRKKDGGEFFVILNASLIKNEKEEDIGIISSFVDITLRKKVDHALKEKGEALTHQTWKMERDLKIAQKTMMDIIKLDLPRVESLRIDYKYYPLGNMGGDYFCFYPLAEGVTGVFMCDISGHGVASSLYISLLKSITDKLAVKFGQAPSDFITQLNLELIGRMSSYFITAVYGVFIYQKRQNQLTFTFANGGHPSPLLVKNDGAASLLSTKSTIIGISNDIRYPQTKIQFAPGDRLFIYTDGIPETSNANREMIGYDDTFKDLFAIRGSCSLGEHLNSVIEKVNLFRNGAEITDDIAIIGFEAVL